MADEEKERSDPEEENQDLWTKEDGLKFLQELREMPYDKSKVGQVFVTFHGRRLADTKDSEKERSE